jgi:hypothetical protein
LPAFVLLVLLAPKAAPQRRARTRQASLVFIWCGGWGWADFVLRGHCG